jgi:pyruvate kinase
LCGPRARVSKVRLAESVRRVHKGDHIWLGSKFQLGGLTVPFQATCGMPHLVEQLAPGATVWMNEGRIGAKVREKTATGLVLEVFHAREKGEKLRADIGLNFPGSPLRVSPLTQKDRTDLDFICHYADAVGYSFVQEPEDMDNLAGEIERRRSPRRRLKPLGVIAKIETDRAVHNLPELIVRGAGRGPFGVMIARGDLAVEIGYLRVAEIQEEILWICEAAHVPVIWATQVLETFAKRGLPSRAEITDAAMSERAECVMLNKGPFIPEAVSILSEMLVRMQAHQWKKMATFRALRSWNHLWHQAGRKHPAALIAPRSESSDRKARAGRNQAKVRGRTSARSAAPAQKAGRAARSRTAREPQ